MVRSSVHGLTRQRTYTPYSADGRQTDSEVSSTAYYPATRKRGDACAVLTAIPSLRVGASVINDAEAQSRHATECVACRHERSFRRERREAYFRTSRADFAIDFRDVQAAVDHLAVFVDEHDRRHDEDAHLRGEAPFHAARLRAG